MLYPCPPETSPEIIQKYEDLLKKAKELFDE